MISFEKIFESSINEEYKKDKKFLENLKKLYIYLNQSWEIARDNLKEDLLTDKLHDLILLNYDKIVEFENYFEDKHGAYLRDRNID
jgi:hypothetical protein